MSKRKRLLLAALLCPLLFLCACLVPVIERQTNKLTVLDKEGVEHTMQLVFLWPIMPLTGPYLCVDFGDERWLVNSGGFGYAATAIVQQSPDRSEVVVAYKFEGASTVFVKFDVASEKGTREHGYSVDYFKNGWKHVEWQRIR